MTELDRDKLAQVIAPIIGVETIGTEIKQSSLSVSLKTQSGAFIPVDTPNAILYREQRDFLLQIARASTESSREWVADELVSTLSEVVYKIGFTTVFEYPPRASGGFTLSEKNGSLIISQLITL